MRLPKKKWADTLGTIENSKCTIDCNIEVVYSATGGIEATD